MELYRQMRGSVPMEHPPTIVVGIVPPGTRFSAELQARFGVGPEHSKWNAGRAFLRPPIRLELDRDALAHLSLEDREQLCQDLGSKVATFVPDTGGVTLTPEHEWSVGHPHLLTEKWGHVLEVHSVPDTFAVVIQTNGDLSPCAAALCGLHILLTELRALLQAVDKCAAMEGDPKHANPPVRRSFAGAFDD